MEPSFLAVMMLGIAGLSLLAYAVRALDGPGAVASGTLGILIAWGAGFGAFLLLLLFTLIGFTVTRIGRRDKRHDPVDRPDGERGLANVVGNGAAAALAVIAGLVVSDDAAVIAFVTAVAAVTADTMASEVGGLSSRARHILPPFGPGRRGENGAVSALGQAAAALGAATIAAAAVGLVGLSPAVAWIPALAGFLGCQLDSVLGATLEGDTVRDGPLSKADVNFIASVAPALIVWVIFVLT